MKDFLDTETQYKNKSEALITRTDILEDACQNLLGFLQVLSSGHLLETTKKDWIEAKIISLKEILKKD